MNPNSNGSITTSTAGTTIQTFTPGSYVVTYIDPTVINVGVNVSGNWGGTLVGYFTPDYVNTISIPNSAFLNTFTGASGLPSGATGQYTLPVSGPGWLFIVATSFSSGTINLNLTVGSGMVGGTGNLPSQFNPQNFNFTAGPSQPYTNITTNGAVLGAPPCIAYGYAWLGWYKTIFNYRLFQSPKVQSGPTYFIAKSNTGNSVAPSDSYDGLDPLGFNLSAATLNGTTLTSTGSFTSYTWKSGDKIYLSAGTPGVGGTFTTGLYSIASKTDANNIVLSQSPVTGTTTAIAITSSTGPWLTIVKVKSSVAGLSAPANYLFNKGDRWDPTTDGLNRTIAVSTNGTTTVTITSPDPTDGFAAGQTVTINSVSYTVASVTLAQSSSPTGSNIVTAITMTATVPTFTGNMTVGATSASWSTLKTTHQIAAVGVWCKQSNVTFGSYGNGPKPSITAFVQIPGGNFSATSGTTNTQQTAVAANIGWLRETGNTDFMYRRMATSADVAAYPGSWAQIAGVLYVNARSGSTPQANQFEITFDCPTIALLPDSVDGCRIDGLSLSGYGCRYNSLLNGATPQNPATSGSTLYDVNGNADNQRAYTIQPWLKTNQGIVISNCDVFYSQNHNIGVLNNASGNGGYLTCINCRVGAVIQNDTPIVAYSSAGGHEIICESCEGVFGLVPYGYLPYVYAASGAMIDAHGGASTTTAIQIYRNCMVRSGPYQLSAIGGGTGFAPTFTDPANCRFWRVDCKVFAHDPGPYDTARQVLLTISATAGGDSTLTVSGAPSMIGLSGNTGGNSPTGSGTYALLSGSVTGQERIVIDQIASLSGNSIATLTCATHPANVGQTSCLWTLGSAQSKPIVGKLAQTAGLSAYDEIDFNSYYEVKVAGPSLTSSAASSGGSPASVAYTYAINTTYWTDWTYSEAGVSSNAKLFGLGGGSVTAPAYFDHCRFHVSGIHGNVSFSLGGVTNVNTPTNWTVQNCVLTTDGNYSPNSTYGTAGYIGLGLGNNQNGSGGLLSPLIQQNNAVGGWTDLSGTLTGYNTDPTLVEISGDTPVMHVPPSDSVLLSSTTPNIAVGSGAGGLGYVLQVDSGWNPRSTTAPCIGPFEPVQVGRALANPYVIQ